MPKRIYIKSRLQRKWPSEPQSRPPKGSKSKSSTVEFFQFNFCLPPLVFEPTTPGFEVGCDTTELRNWSTKNFVTKISKSFRLSGRVLDFKSRGPGFESLWGQTKINLKEILPWRILISSDFEPLGYCNLGYGNSKISTQI